MVTAKEYLQQIYKIDKRINITLAKTQKMKESLYGKGIEMNDTPSSNHGTDTLGKTICKVMEYEEKANQLIDRLVDLRLDIEAVIDTVSNSEQKEVLERRYLLFQPWESYYDEENKIYVKGIAEYMGYSARQIYRIHGEALKSINVSQCQLMSLNGSTKNDIIVL